MLTDPQSITINAVASDYNRVESVGKRSTYVTSDGTKEFIVSHQESKNRIRRMVRLNSTVVASDPLTAENAYQKAGVYLVVDEPTYGFTDADVDHLVDALVAWLSSANIAELLATQH
jgi:hypothetical protein